MTKAKRDRTIKLGTLKQALERLKKWKKNRQKFSAYPLDTEVLDITIAELEKVCTYFTINKMYEFEIGTEPNKNELSKNENEQNNL